MTHHARMTTVRHLLLLLLCSSLAACVSAPPDNPGNVCKIFEDKRSWYKAAQRAERRWQVPMTVNMAILYQESSFKGRAKPPRRYYLGFIPGRRPSNAYGYAQALDSTWDEYKQAAGSWGARRSNFGDAVDFVGWYNNRSNAINGIRKDDAYNLYLAYHEGNGGFRNGSWRNKDWLLQAASSVQNNADRYTRQLQSCRADLNRNWLRRLLF
jgi:hypothetical protein